MYGKSSAVTRMFLTVAEVAEELNIGRTKIYEWIKDGTLPSVRLGGNLRVPIEPFREWCEGLSRDAALRGGR